MDSEPLVPKRWLARHAEPMTSAGWRCLVAFGLGAVGLLGLMASVASGQEGGDTFADNWWLSAPAFLAAIGFVVSFVFGVFAIVLRHERSLPVYVATAFGAFVVFFITGEIVALN